ncbi:hypothetical protein EYR40_009167 [Pleurotus pulmonarius]|nr:hypothetical protein EYR40_009167 [Pleurotus pulmonarius]
MQTQKQAQAQVQQPRAQPGAQPPRDTRETRHPPAQTQVQATAPPCTRNRVIDVRARGVPPGTPREPRSDRLRKENAHMGAKNKHMLSDYDRDHLCNARSHANNARVGTNDRLQTTTPVRALSPARASCDRARVAGGAGTGVLQGVESGSRPVLALPARAHTQAEMQRQGEGEGMRHIRAEPPQGQVAPRDKTRVQEAQRPPPPQVQRPQRSPPQQQAQPPSPTPRKPLPSLQAKAPAKRRDVQLGVQVPSRSTFDFSFPRAVSCAPKGEENEVGVGREGKGVEAPARSRTPLFLLSNSSTPTTPTFSLSPAPFVEASSSSSFSHAAGAAGEGAREGMEVVPQWRLSMIPGHELNVIRSGDMGIGMGGAGSFGERSSDPSSSTFAARMEDVSGDELETPQVLIIPELLRRIFEFSSHESNISYARVCKNWSEEALSVLWSSVEAYPLFALLAPMTLGFGSEWSFSRDVEEVDWERFERYSWRVKSLQFNTQFSASVFHAVAVGRRRLDFLPNLEAVYNPPPSLNLFPLFAHASVKTLEIHPGFDAKNMGLLPSRMPHIECLTCLTRGTSPGSIIPSAFQQLQSLMHLTISDECLNVDLFHALAALPNLCSISSRQAALLNESTSAFRFSTTTPPSTAPSGSTESVASKIFPVDPFPSLKELDVQLRFATAIEWIQIASRSGSLRILKIHSPHKESAADYMQLTSHIGLLCMRLENLELSRRASAGCISAEASCGIESLTGLKSLTLRAFDARSDSQIERMLEPLSALETMSITGGQIKTPLHQIALIAHHCGKLHTLELDVDTWKMPSAALPDSFFLRHLRQLHVGAANISQTQATFVATFLSRVLPLSCTIEFDSSLPPDVSDTWGEVQNLGMNTIGVQGVPRVLCVPELLRRVFELSTDQANVSHASVCKTWNQQATRTIWRDVSTDRLFSLLAPLVAPPNGDGDEAYPRFSREIREEDWDRFDKYSHKVRSLRFSRAYDPSVFKEIALARRRLDFLPNLVTLYNAQPTLLLTYSSIKRLIFTENMFVGHEIISWLNIIESRMRHIEYLHIDPYYHEPLGDVQSAFTSALKRMKSLKELDVPTGFLNDSNFYILPSISSLQRLSSVCPFWFQPPDNFSARSLSQFPTDPFRSLQEFNVHLNFNTAMVCIPTLGGFRLLRVLKITSDTTESFESYIILLDLISLHCPRLKVLQLAMDFRVVGSTMTPVESTTIECIKKYTRRVRHLLQSLQHLESLTLQDFGVQGSVPLRDLPHFSHSRTLRVLHLDLDSSLISDDIAPCDFPALKRLHFGPSSTPISQPTEVANFLSRILPPRCEISLDADADIDREKYEQVKLWLPILIKARMEGREAFAEMIKVEE